MRGVLYVDYVRMIRRQLPAWRSTLDPACVAALDRIVDVDGWYPMEDFERLGLAILDHVVGGEHDSIRLWGRQTVQALLGFLPDLQASAPDEAVRRMQPYLSSLFDFPVMSLESVGAAGAVLRVSYFMGPRAEEAATWQAIGFFEELVVASGGRAASGSLLTRAWSGAPSTTFAITWSTTAPSPRPFLDQPRVLLVDDEALVAKALARLLAKAANVSVALSVAEALDLLSAGDFDAVISDYNMPGRDGLSFLEEVSRRWPHVTRVLHSGAMPAEASQAVARGVVHELVDKPAPRDVLIRAVSTRPR